MAGGMELHFSDSGGNSALVENKFEASKTLFLKNEKNMITKARFPRSWIFSDSEFFQISEPEI